MSHAGVKTCISDAIRTNRLRRDAGYCADRDRQLQVPPLSEIDGAYNDPDARPWPGDAHHLCNSSISVTLFKHRNREDAVECLFGKWKIESATPCEHYAVAELAGQFGCFPQQKRIDIDGINPSCGAELRREQSIERARAAPNIQDTAVGPGRHNVHQVPKHRPVCWGLRPILQYRHATDVTASDLDHREVLPQLRQGRFPLRGCEQKRQKH